MNLQLKVEERVLVIFNTNISDNLVNGAFGTVIDIILTKNGEAESVIVSLDNPETGVRQRKEFKHVA